MVRAPSPRLIYTPLCQTPSSRLMRTRLALLAVSVAAVAASVTAQAPQDRGQPTFRSGASYVRVDMYATRDGQSIDDLKAADVEVLEDGVPQKVEDFEHVVVRSATTPTSRVEVDGVRGSREAAGDPRARVFVIFLDTYHTQAFGSARMRKPLVAFLDRVLGPDDLVALMTPEMAASDIALGRKTAVISKVLTEEWWGRRGRIADDDEKENRYRACGADMGLPEALVEEMIARRREKMTFDALEDLLVHLGGLRDERKAVITVTEGWLLFGPNPKLAEAGRPAQPPAFRPPVPPPTERGAINQPLQVECEADRRALALLDHDTRLRRIGEEANRGNVTFYPIFANGLVVFDSSIAENVSPQKDIANLRTRQESMRSLAVDTDGEAIINTNYIEKGLKRIADDLSSYYLFGYYSTNTKLDGRYRTITVRVKQPGVRVRARRGYRARTAEQVVAAAVAANVDPASTAVTNALNSVAGVNARSTFRVRPTVWMRTQGGTTGGAVWVVGEIEFRTRREPAWVAGASGEVLLLSAGGDQLGSSPVEVPAGQGAFSVRVPTASPLAAGDYAVRVRLSGRDASASDTVRVTVPEKPSAVGEAVMWRRGGSTGPQFVRTADPRFQRSDRLRLELATDTNMATARLLDRLGKALQVPVQVSERADAEGIRWIVADVTLAPLAPGDYAIEVTAGGATQVTGFRVIP